LEAGNERDLNSLLSTTDGPLCGCVLLPWLTGGQVTEDTEKPAEHCDLLCRQPMRTRAFISGIQENESPQL
jgi:hypothetical protein